MNEAHDVARVVASIAPKLAGHPPQIQGAAIADLLATWIAGHAIPGNPSETDALRERIMEMHIEMVRKLVAIEAPRLWAESEGR